MLPGRVRARCVSHGELDVDRRTDPDQFGYLVVAYRGAEVVRPFDVGVQRYVDGLPDRGDGRQRQVNRQVQRAGTEILHDVDQLLRAAQRRTEYPATGRHRLYPGVPTRPGTGEQAQLDIVCGGERDHVADLRIGLQHHAAALADPVYRDVTGGRLVEYGAQRGRPLDRGNLHPVLATVGKPLVRRGQVVRVATGQSQLVAQKRARPLHACPPRRRRAGHSEPASRPAGHGQLANRMLCPQSTLMTAPVTAQARSEARNTTTAATSAGSAIRPSGCCASTARSAAAGSGCWLSHSSTRYVRVKPGATALTRTLYGPQSHARLRVSPSRPAFAAAYANIPGTVSRAWIDEMFTIAPARFAVRRGNTYFDVSQAAFRSTANTASQSASTIVVASKYALTPALFTSTSMSPNRSTQARTAAATSGSRRTSARTNSACPPCASRSRTVSAPDSAMSTTATCPPSAITRSAVARPMPRAPPVTSTTFSLSNIGAS